MWLPTPDAMVERMLPMAKTTSTDVVYDLGAGDGRLPIVAAQTFGATAVGIEYDRDLAALARRNAERAGVAGKVTIIQGDIFKEDFSRATVVTLYLLPDLNQQLRPQLLAMKPGTRVVSHAWDMGEWEPDATQRIGDSEAFLWIVPARVEGRWTLARRRRILRGRARADPAIPARRRHAHAARQACSPCSARMSKAISSASRSSISTAACAACARGSTAARSAGSLRFAGTLTPVTGADR